MFSKAYYDEILRCFEEQMTLLEDRRELLTEKETRLPEEDRGLYNLSRQLLEKKIREIQETLAHCGQDQGEALRYLYSASPLSDLLDYPASLYLAYAEHGVFLWKEGPFAGKVPERIFANYVLHHRVHNEDLADTRRFFYDHLKTRTAGKNMYDAVLETNRWCAEKATYRSTYPRTQNPLTMYNTAVGRCGEEAPFAVTALRSLGIPAREAATPLWAHCDDNHAWVEAWCDGQWHFFGACEPEESLDGGWFVNATSRAMLIDSVWFGKDAPLDPVVDRPDMSARLNHLPLYAKTARLKVRVVDEEGAPVPGARVEFALPNSGRLGVIARLYTCGEEGSVQQGSAEAKSVSEEENVGHGTSTAVEERAGFGTVELDTGLGDLLVCAGKGACYGEALASLTRSDECTVVIRREWRDLNQWRELDFHAPKGAVGNEQKTDAQLAAEQAVLEAAARSRQQRTADFYQEEEAERVLAHFEAEDRMEIQDILRKACGNMGEIVRFLEWDFGDWAAPLRERYGEEHWKLEALKTLGENDYWDISAEILVQCCICAAPYAVDYPKEIFFSCLLRPCAAFEKASGCRKFLQEALSEKQKEKIRKEPGGLPALLEKLVVSLPGKEYANLAVSPAGCLTGGIGSSFSRTVLCVNIYRALGIPARLRHLDRKVEYYTGGEFVAADTEAAAPSGKVVITLEEPLTRRDWKRYSLAKFEDGHFTPLFLRPPKPQAKGNTSKQDSGKKGEEPENILELILEPGIYRAVTANRLPNGNQLVKICNFELQADEVKQLQLSVREISAEDLKERIPVEDYALGLSRGDLPREAGRRLGEQDGRSWEKITLTELSSGGKALLVWLELTREPTEHILNEIRERKQMFENLAAPICFVVREGVDFAQDPTLRRTLEALPKIRILTDSFGEEYEKLSGRVGCSPGMLPLAVVLEGESSVYADCGYNVGMADILLRLLS